MDYGEMTEKRPDKEPAVISLKGNSRTRKHRLAEIITEEAEEEIKDYANEPLQDSVRGNNL